MYLFNGLHNSTFSRGILITVYYPDRVALARLRMQDRIRPSITWSVIYCHLICYLLSRDLFISTIMRSVIFCHVICYILSSDLLYTVTWSGIYCHLICYILSSDLLYTVTWSGIYCQVICDLRWKLWCPVMNCYINLAE